MDFSCFQADLNHALSVVKRAISSRPSHVVLSNILISAIDSGKVIFSGSDLSVNIFFTIDADVDVAGQITVPAKVFTSIVSKLSDNIVRISLQDTFLHVKTTEGSFTLNTISAEEYPALPSLKGATKFKLLLNQLLIGIKRTIFSASTDESKYILTGLRIKTEDNTISFTTSDGHRMSIVEFDNEKTELNFTSVIPAKNLKDLESNLAHYTTTDNVEVCLSDTLISFEIDNFKLISRLVEGSFPKCENLLPKKFVTELVCSREKLISTLELISILADKDNLVNFICNTTNSKLAISTQSKDVGNGEYAIEANITGADVELGLNSKYVLEGLKTYSEKEISLKVSEGNPYCIFSPLGEDKTIFLVAPVIPPKED